MTTQTKKYFFFVVITSFMKYLLVSDTYTELEKTTKRLELVEILSHLFQNTPSDLIDKVIYLTQGKLAPDFAGIELGINTKLAIKAVSSASSMSELEIENTFNETGDIGESTKIAIEKKSQTSLYPNPLTLERVFDTFYKIANVSGKGSLDIKIKHIISLLNDSTPIEAKYIIRTITGNLRLGVADYTVLDGLSLAFTGSKTNRPIIERAYNISSDLGLVAKILSKENLDVLKSFQITVGKPIRPMLAERLSSPSEITKKIGGKFAAEFKLDGERLQIHINDSSGSIFSRKLENITDHYKDVIESCNSNLKFNSLIIEGEAVAVDNDGKYLPFQELMHRRRKHDIDIAIKKYPIIVNLFDLLYLDGKDFTGLAYSERRKKLNSIISSNDSIKIVDQIEGNTSKEIQSFMDKSLNAGMEGLVVKDLKGIYRAGAREFLWIKLKKEYMDNVSDTLDLVVVGALYGKGRRTGIYGALLLASYDKANDQFCTFCKVGTGFKDADLESIHSRLSKLVINQKDDRVFSKIDMDVWFIPDLVLEISGSEITLSPIHTTNLDLVKKDVGLGLRFPIFTGNIRDDKNPEDITDVTEIFNMFNSQ